MDKKIEIIESEIDRWIFDNLDCNIPRYKYIYHCNLAYIDILIEYKMMFSEYERHYLFSLNYNTHIAYIKLKEEEKFDYQFDKQVYKHAFNMVNLGMQYSMLCDIFPLLHSEKASMSIEGNDVFFKIDDFPRKHYKFISDFTMRTLLSYTLQMANGLYQKHNINDEDISMKLADLYMHFFNENMEHYDYEPYTAMEWGGISFFLIVAAMRRFNKLYKANFNIISLDAQKMMILMTSNGVDKMRTFVPSNDDKLYNVAFEDHIYKPMGKGLYPKASIADAPLIKTKDGYIFSNSLVILFNDSLETQFLNYTRRCNNERYLRIKDKIKEREIPIITEMVKYKFSNCYIVANFNVKIPKYKKGKRECDLLLVDDNGIALYLEIKHFYNPQSFCEMKVLDNELQKALKKMPDQLDAIRTNWKDIKNKNDFPCDLNELYGVIVSHRYTGYNVEITPETPIVSVSNLFESIVEATCIKEIYLGCREVDELYPKINFIQEEIILPYAGYNFHVKQEALNPAGELLIKKVFQKKVYDSLNSLTPKSYSNIKDLAHAYLDEMQKD